MDKEYPDISALTGLFQGIGEAIATRPQKTSTFTTTTSTPYAREDMIKNRDRIGTARQNLADILKLREKPLYSVANALSAVPEQQGAGSWLSNLVRGFGAGATSHTNTMVDRAQKEYEAEMQDLAQILAYDKAMGDTQTQSQTMGYTPMEYAGGSGKGGAKKGGGADTISGIPTKSFGRSRGYDPVADFKDFSPITRAAANNEQIGMGNWLNIPGSASFLKGLAGDSSADLQTLHSDIADNLVSGKILDYINNVGSVRVADTKEEKDAIFGPLANYKEMSSEELKNAINQARNNFVTSVKNQYRAAGQDIDTDYLQNLFNSAFTVPKSLKTEKRYNIQDAPRQPAASTAPATAGGNDWSKYKDM